jgi:hypothetical protein
MVSVLRNRTARRRAGVSAAPAGIRTNAAMLVHLRVFFAFLHTQPAGCFARREGGENKCFVGASAARCDVAGRCANISAVQIESNTLAELVYHLLAEASVSAHRTDLRAVEALFNASNKRVVCGTAYVWMGADDLFRVHRVLLNERGGGAVKAEVNLAPSGACCRFDSAQNNAHRFWPYSSS